MAISVTLLQTVDGSGSLAVTAAGCTADDVLLAFCDSDNGSPPPSAPAGWVQLAIAAGDATWDRLSVWARPGADGTYNFGLVGGADGSVTLVRVRGDGPVRVDVASGADNTLVAPSVDSLGGLLLNYWLHWGNAASAIAAPGTPDATFLNNHQSSGWGRRLGVAYAVSAGATGTRTATTASPNTTAAVSIAVTESTDPPAPAVARIGSGSVVATDGSAPGAVGVHADTATGDRLLWHWYSRTTGTNEVVTWPAGWTPVAQYRDTSGGLIALATRDREAGDSTYTATASNHATGASGETILTWIESFRGHDPSVPVSVSNAASIWGSSTTLGAIAPNSVGDVPAGGILGVFAGRKENVTGQNTLTGDGLSWQQGQRGDTSSGSDAGAVTQHATNPTGAPVTPTSKSITTTGTAQTGKGLMYVVHPAADSPDPSEGELEQGHEVDSAGDLTPAPGAVDGDLEQAGETDTAGEFTPVLDDSQDGVLEQAGEVDAAGEATPVPGPVDVEAEQAAETDEAGELAPDPGGVAATLDTGDETDAAGTLAPAADGVDGELGQAGETDTAGEFGAVAVVPPPTVKLDYTGDRFLAAISGPHEPVSKAWLIDGSDETELPTVLDGSVTLGANVTTRAQCDLQIADDGTLGWIPVNSQSSFAPYSNEIRISRGVRYPDGTEELYPLGRFRIDTATVDDTGDQLALSIQGTDRSARVSDAKFEAPYQVAADTNYGTAIVECIQAVWPDVPHDLPTTTYTTPKIFVAEEGSDRWEFCQRMAEACGWWLYFDANGVLTADPVTQFVTGSPAWEVAEGENGVLVAVNRSWTRLGSFNKAIVTGENPADPDAPVRGEAVDDNPLSPTYYHGPFGQIPDFFHSGEIDSSEQAADVAAARLARQLGTIENVSFGSVVNPRLQPNDVVRVRRERIGLDRDHVVSQLTVPLSAEGTMQAETRATVVV